MCTQSLPVFSMKHLNIMLFYLDCPLIYRPTVYLHYLVYIFLSLPTPSFYLFLSLPTLSFYLFMSLPTLSCLLVHSYCLCFDDTDWSPCYYLLVHRVWKRSLSNINNSLLSTLLWAKSSGVNIDDDILSLTIFPLCDIFKPEFCTETLGTTKVLKLPILMFKSNK